MQFRHLVPEAALFPNKADGNPLTVGPQFVPDRLREGWASRGETLRVVIGHYPACLMDELGGDFLGMTVLRDPVERTLSLLRHHWVIHPEEADRNAWSIYRDPVRFHGQIHNHMVKMLGMTSEEMGPQGMLTRLECTQAHLDRAKRRLESMALVGLQDDLLSFCTALQQQYGFQVDCRPRVNVTEATVVPPGLTERIVEDNSLDLALWQFARELVRS